MNDIWTEHLIARARHELALEGTLYLDTWALLEERGIDVRAITRDYNHHNGDMHALRNGN